MHAKTENTVFNQYYIPTKDLTQVITEDVVIKVIVSWQEIDTFKQANRLQADHIKNLEHMNDIQ